MGRYTGPSCRLCRRAGEKLFLKGDRCFSPRCAIERRHIPPGGGGNRRRRVSDYGVHLREKQKARQMYGVMEGQFRKYMTGRVQHSGNLRQQPAANAGTSAGQRGFPAGVCRFAQAGPPNGAARPFHRQRAQNRHTFFYGNAGANRGLDRIIPPAGFLRGTHRRAAQANTP